MPCSGPALYLATRFIHYKINYMIKIFPFIFSITACLPLAGMAQNVGVGTKNAPYLMTVKDSLGSGMGIAQVSPDGQTALGTYASNGNAYVQTHTNTDLKFATNNGAYQMVIQKGTGNVGIGSIVPTQKLEVAGNAKINGNLQVLGGGPAAGKVLTSDAAGNGTWSEAAFSNKERFQFRTTQVAGGLPLTFSTRYNMGTASTQYIGAYTYFSLYIAKAGLYHFDLSLEEIGYQDFTQASTDPRLATMYFVIAAGQEFQEAVEYKKDKIGSSFPFKAYANKAIEMYVPANTQIQVGGSGNFTYSSFLYFTLTGHLISE